LIEEPGVADKLLVQTVEQEPELLEDIELEAVGKPVEEQTGQPANIEARAEGTEPPVNIEGQFEKVELLGHI
jgi:hypothetical protein